MSKQLLLTTKKYRISTQAKNSKGLRIRTSGIDISGYKNNPLLLWMHQRPEGKKDDVLPLGNIVELELKNDELWGRLGFDPDDKFAISIYNKYENGTLRMVSAGLVPLKLAKHAGDVWVDFSKLKETSCVDIGSNPESYEVKLYQDTEELLRLSYDSLKQDYKELFKNENKMDDELLQGAIPILKLSEGSGASEALAAIQAMATASATNAARILTLKEEKEEVQGKYDDLLKLQNETKILTLVDGAIEKGKFTADQKQKWIKLAEGDFDGVKELIETMPENKSVNERLNLGGDDEELKGLLKLSYVELDEQGLVEKLKEKSPVHFKQKFKEHYEVDYKD